MTTSNATAVTEAAELGRQAANANAIDYEEIQTGLIVRVVRQDERIQTVDLEHTLDAPHGCRGDAKIYEPADYIRYVNRLTTPSTTVWADPDRGTITAVFDDHETGAIPGWRRHRATLTVRRDPEWVAWAGQSGRLGSQEQFAEFIEDHLMAVVDPDPATMLEVATSFQARRNASFDRGTRLQSGDVQLRWTETTTATAGTKGQLEVPERFTVRVAPYLGVAPVDLQARLRWRINDGQLRIGFALHRPDLAEQEAFDHIRGLVDAETAVPIHLGEAPATLHVRASA